MPRISHLTRESPVQVVFSAGDGETITLTFDRNKITSHWIDQDLIRRRDQQDAWSLSKSLAEIIMSWNVTTDDDQSLEPNAENVSLLSIPAQNALFERIMDAAKPSSAEGNVSASTSSTPSNVSSSTPASPQNGPGPSPSPELSTSQSQT